LFLIQGATSFDVANASPVINGGNAFTALFPAGTMSALVATGAFELMTTEYVAGTYLPNDKLTSPTEAQITGSNFTAAGLLTNLTGWPSGAGPAPILGKNNICGIVSRGVVPDMNNVSRLAFWPVYAPGNSTSSNT
jgi:hypothetical protein